MKNIFLIISLISIIACQEEPKNYATLSGTITNAHESDTLRIFNRDNYEKIIPINEDGTFSDTLNIVEGDYRFKHGDEYGTIYLKNNTVSSFTTDYEDFDNELVFIGDGSDINNLAIKSLLLGNDYFSADLFNEGVEEDLTTSIANYTNAFEDLKDNYKNVDSLHLANANTTQQRTIESVNKYFNSKIALRKEYPAGMASPPFDNYENHKGGTTSLSDLKGKYVYVDVWATWCGPCKREIPSLQKVEEQYHDKNIEFVSISVDDARRSGTDEKAHTAWKKMVEDKKLGGIQLFSDKAWQSDFIQAYKITGIPRFLLIDPDGKIVSADAPRPSNPKLIELFNSLNI